MKQWICVICILALLCSLPACHSQAPNAEPTGESAAQATASLPEVETTVPPPSEETPTEATLTETGLREGYYLYTGSTVEGEFVAPGDLLSHIRLDPGHSGYIYANGLVSTVSWSNTYLIDNGSTYRFTVEDDVLLIDYIISVNHYTYIGDEPPGDQQVSIPPAGEYIVFSMESDYYEDRSHIIPDPSNGMLRLDNDGTCTFFIDAEAKKGTWDVAIQIQSSPLPYCYLDSTLSPDGIPFLMVIYGARTFFMAPVIHDTITNTYIWEFLTE